MIFWGSLLWVIEFYLLRSSGFGLFVFDWCSIDLGGIVGSVFFLSESFFVDWSSTIQIPFLGAAKSWYKSCPEGFPSPGQFQIPCPPSDPSPCQI